MVFNTTFNNISVIRGGQFYWWRKPEYSEKTTDLAPPSYRQTLSHNVVHIVLSGIEPTISVVIGTDCIGSCKSNYHTITSTVPVDPWKIREYREIERGRKKVVSVS